MIWKSYFTFDQKKIKTLELKKKLVLQNIQLIKNRFYHKKFSYTRLVKGFSFYVEQFIELVRFLGNLSLYSIFLFSIFFIFMSTFNTLFHQSLSINTSFFFLVVLVSFFTFFSKLIRNFYLLSIFGCIYGFLFIFLIINL